MADACPGFAELISAAIDGALTPEEARTLEGHLGRCAACREHDARVRAVVRTVRGAGPLLALSPEALGARLSALDVRLAGDSARLAPAPQGEPTLEVEPALAVASSGRLVTGIAWGRSAWVVVRVAAALAFFAFALSVFQAKWAEFNAKKPTVATNDGGRTVPTPSTSEVPPPSTETPTTPAPPPTTEVTPPPVTTELIPDVDPDVPPIPPDPANVPPVSPPTTTEPQAPTTTEGQPGGDPTRVRDPSQPGARPRVDVQLATRPQVQALIESILDRATPPEQRLSQLRSLGDARFDQPLAYEFLASVLLEGTLDGHDLPNECRWAAVGALGAHGTDEAAQVLLLALAGPPRDAHKDADDAALCTALSALQDDAAVERLGSALAGRFADDVDRGLLALRALAAHPRPAAVDGLLELYGKSRAPTLLREAGAVLGATGDPRALAALVSGIEGRTSPVRQGAALGLGALAAARPVDAPACLAALQGGLARERDLGLGCAVVRGLRLSGAREAIPLLIELTDVAIERRAPVRVLAGEALVAITGETLPHADAWRAWWRGAPALPSPGADLPLGRPTIALQFFNLPSLADGVVFVLDVSGSMGQGGKWEKARAELARAIEPMTDRVRFQVVFFHHAPVPVFNQGLVPATAANKQRALRALEQQRPLGVAQTAIGRALELALGWTQADTIYFVSDGADTSQDVAALRLRVARQNARRELPARIHAVLLRAADDEVLLDTNPEDPAAPFDVRLMRGLARDSGGVFVRNGRAP